MLAIARVAIHRNSSCFCLSIAILFLAVGCASQRSTWNGTCRGADEGAATEPDSSQRIVDLAVSMQGRHADEVGTNPHAWPFALTRYLQKKGSGLHDYESWCSEFVCWTYAAAGWPLASGAQDRWMLKNTHNSEPGLLETAASSARMILPGPVSSPSQATMSDSIMP